jgi:DNA (cytosine-5)-methyltransferase 1
VRDELLAKVMGYLMKVNEIKLFSFFAGAGFLDYGFEKVGFEPVYVNEFHKPFLEAYKYARRYLKINEPEFGYYNGDIQDLLSGPNQKRLKEFVSSIKSTNAITGFIGGPPCPDFSAGGKNRGRHGDNGKLSASYIKLICDQKPDFFLFENVKGLWQTKLHRAFYEELKEKLHHADYYTTERLINSIEYGAPQDRDRIILLGFHKKLDFGEELKGPNNTLVENAFQWTRQLKYPGRQAFNNFNWPITSAFVENSTTVAPENLPVELTVEHWFQRNNVESHPNASHVFVPRAGLARFQTVAEGDDTEKSYKRLHRWRYSPTAAYGNNEVHLHPYKARRISAAEALAIQSLPANFSLPSDMTLSNMFKTIGNGVPFLAALGLATEIKLFLGSLFETDSNQPSASHQPNTKERVIHLRPFR